MLAFSSQSVTPRCMDWETVGRPVEALRVDPRVDKHIGDEIIHQRVLAIVGILETTREPDPVDSRVVANKQIVGRRTEEAVVLVRMNKIGDVCSLIEDH